MTTSSYTVGFVYILTNESMPGMVKIGLTSGLSEDRAKELYTTGVPMPFKVVYRTTTSRPEAVEWKAHELLNMQRVNSNREFFYVSVDEAINAVRQALVDTASINSWQHTSSRLPCARQPARSGLCLYNVRWTSDKASLRHRDIGRLPKGDVVLGVSSRTQALVRGASLTCCNHTQKNSSINQNQPADSTFGEWHTHGLRCKLLRMTNNHGSSAC